MKKRKIVIIISVLLLVVALICFNGIMYENVASHLVKKEGIFITD